MAESGVTSEGLKTTLVEKLQATHVEIEDRSGTSSVTYSLPRLFLLTLADRRLRSKIFCSDRFSAICPKDVVSS
jgi:hypothetical protein